MKWLLGIILPCLLFLLPLFHNGFYESHDGEAHVARFAAYFHAFQDGDFPPRWAGSLNFDYGTPIFIFYYPLPGYLASLFHLVGINFETIFKILMVGAFIAAPIGFYFWMRLVVKKEVAFIGAFLFGFAPYHFLDVYVRGDIAEMLAFVFVPFVFWAIEKTLLTKKWKFIFWGGIFYAFLILSHNGVSLMFSPVFLMYALLKSRSKKEFTKFISLFGIGLCLTSFFWMPALAEGKYVNAKLFIGDMYKDHFPSVLQLIYSHWGFGANVTDSGGLSPQIGILPLLLVIISVIYFFKQKKSRKIFGMWLGVFVISVFVSLSVSGFVWSKIAILRLYEFPWRFVGLASFAAAVLGTLVLDKVKNKKVLLLVGFLLLILSIPFVRVKRYLTEHDTYYKNFTGTTYYHGEASPIWTAGDPVAVAKKPIEVIGGKGVVLGISKKNTDHTIVTKASDTLTLVDNTTYFPGWKVAVDGVQTTIQFQDPNHRGVITFQVPPGNHTVRVMFTETKLRLLTDIFSLVGWVFVISMLVLSKLKIKLLKAPFL